MDSEVTGFKVKTPAGDVGLSTEKEKFSLALGIGEITTKTKSDPQLREELNQYLGPQKTRLLEAIDRELLEPAIAKLKQQGKKGLVVAASLYKQAADVLPACEKAVALSPSDRNIQDSRGLARALTGNFKGAIADFEAYIAEAYDKESKAQRQRWVKELRAGKNPFTDAELKKLRDQ